jgi:hypothetical protein
MSITERIGRSSALLGIGLLLLIALIAARTIFSCNSPTQYSHCDQKVVREFPSPNGRSVGLVIRTNCGATTPFVASAGIRPNGKDLDFDRDIFFSIKGDGNDVELIWRDSHILDVVHEFPALTVVYDKPTLIYRQAIVWGMERIAYRER